MSIYLVLGLVGWVHTYDLFVGSQRANWNWYFSSFTTCIPRDWTPIFRLESKQLNHPLLLFYLFVCVEWGGHFIRRGHRISQSWSCRHFAGCLAYCVGAGLKSQLCSKHSEPSLHPHFLFLRASLTEWRELPSSARLPGQWASYFRLQEWCAALLCFLTWVLGSNPGS